MATAAVVAAGLHDDVWSRPDDIFEWIAYRPNPTRRPTSDFARHGRPGAVAGPDSELREVWLDAAIGRCGSRSRPSGAGWDASSKTRNRL